MQMREFSELESVGRLRKLAADSFDLSRPGALDGARIKKYRASACGFDYLYATQRIDDEVLDVLQEMADEAGLVDQYLAMKRGEVMNRIEGFASEDRQVLHTRSEEHTSELQ